MRLIEQDLLWSRVGNEVVVLDQRSQMYLGINPTGAALWDLLVAGCHRDDLVSRLVEVFGISADTADRDVDAFLGSLREEGLLEESDDEPPPSG